MDPATGLKTLKKEVIKTEKILPQLWKKVRRSLWIFPWLWGLTKYEEWGVCVYTSQWRILQYNKADRLLPKSSQNNPKCLLKRHTYSRKRCPGHFMTWLTY